MPQYEGAGRQRELQGGTRREGVPSLGGECSLNSMGCEWDNDWVGENSVV